MVIDFLKVIDREFYFGSLGDCNYVQYGIGGFVKGSDNCYCIFKSFMGYDVVWFNVFMQQMVDGSVYFVVFCLFFYIFCWDVGVEWQVYIYGFNCRCYGICCIYIFICVWLWVGIFDNGFKVGFINCFGNLLFVGFEGRDDIQFLVFVVVWCNCFFVDNKFGVVEVSQGYYSVWYIFIIVYNWYDSIILLCRSYCFN